jgi:hypothetical protein
MPGNRNIFSDVPYPPSAIIPLMRLHLHTKLALLVAALILCAASLPAQMMVGEYGFDDGIMRIWQQPSFYTDYVTTTVSGEETSIFKGLVAKSGTKMRMDMDQRGMAGLDESGSMDFMLYTGTIIKPNSPLIMLYHIPQKYMIMESKPGDEKPDMGILGDEEKPQKEEKPVVEKVKVGEEKIDNHPCIIYNVTVTYKDGRKVTGKVWEATDYGDVKPYLKVIVNQPDGPVTLELHNLKIGKPADTWFEIPAGYTQIKDFMELMPAGMMQGMGGQG